MIITHSIITIILMTWRKINPTYSWIFLSCITSIICNNFFTFIKWCAVPHVCDPGTAQLIVGIRNTLNMYDVDHADSTISGIILTGTGARLIGLPPVLASSINKMVRIGDPFIRFKLSKEVERQNIVAHAVDLGGVLGLVIGKKPR